MNEFLLSLTSTLDGQGNVLSTREYTYDENGNLIEERRPFDGLSGDSTTYTYDENDNLISITNRYTGSLSSSSTTNYTYDENGNLATASYGTAISGTDEEFVMDRLTSYAYDGDNNLVSESIDYDLDGNADRFINYTYDENDNLVSERTIGPNSHPNSLDGNTESFINYTYDENNNLIEEASNSQGIGDFSLITSYAYDENNNLVQEQYDYNDNGFIDILYTYTYDENNNLVSESLDNDANGVIEETVNYTYDESNNLISESLDNGADGVIDQTVNYTYLQDNQESGLSLTDVHRFYQYEQGFHLYTSDINEIAYIQEQSEAGELSYQYEAEQYQVLADNRDTITGEEIAGVKPIYRFFNNDTGAHLYTMDENEKDSIQDNLTNYSFEGIQYYAFESEPENLETIGVYRLLNTSSGAHLFSSDRNEIESIETDLPNFIMENNGDAAFYVFEL